MKYKILTIILLLFFAILRFSNVSVVQACTCNFTNCFESSSCSSGYRAMTYEYLGGGCSATTPCGTPDPEDQYYITCSECNYGYGTIPVSIDDRCVDSCGGPPADSGGDDDGDDLVCGCGNQECASGNGCHCEVDGCVNDDDESCVLYTCGGDDDDVIPPPSCLCLYPVSGLNYTRVSPTLGVFNWTSGGPQCPDQIISIGNGGVLWDPVDDERVFSCYQDNLNVKVQEVVFPVNYSFWADKCHSEWVSFLPKEEQGDVYLRANTFYRFAVKALKYYDTCETDEVTIYRHTSCEVSPTSITIPAWTGSAAIQSQLTREGFWNMNRKVRFTSSNPEVAQLATTLDSTWPYTSSVWGRQGGTATITVEVLVGASNRVDCVSQITVNVTGGVSVDPWWQVKDSDLISSGQISSNVPPANYLSLPGAGGYPGVVVSALGLNIGSGGVSTTNWYAETPTSIKAFSSKNIEKQLPSDVVQGLALTDNQISNSEITQDMLTTGGYEDANGYFWYLYTGTEDPYLYSGSTGTPPPSPSPTPIPTSSPTPTPTPSSTPTGFSAVGGNIVEPGDGYRYHVFKKDGVFDITDGTSGYVDVLLVGEGGGGAQVWRGGGGGGGGGGVVYETNYFVDSDINVTVGSTDNVQKTGENTVFSTLIALGGGKGGGYGNGGDGASGGGGAGGPTATFGGVGLQGFNGGGTDPNAGVNQIIGGGGGGAGQEGGLGHFIDINSKNAGFGGNGTSAYANILRLSLTGVIVNDSWYVGGGGAGSDYAAEADEYLGGFGGGGNNGRSGEKNTGGGGGGESVDSSGDTVAPAGNGGSGLVVVRYPIGNVTGGSSGGSVVPPAPVGTIDLSNRKVIVFTPGKNLLIQANVSLDDGQGLFVAITGKDDSGSGGNITVIPEVTNLEGIYLADGTFSTGSRGQGMDVQLAVRGAVAGLSGVNMQRDLIDNSSPAEYWEYGADQAMLFMANPALGTSRVNWKEVAP